MSFESSSLRGGSDKPKKEKRIDPLLAATIYDEAAKARRRDEFDQVWSERYKPLMGREGYFQTPKQESPFSEYSSKGWKVHIAFAKGREKDIGSLLYVNGLYFKVEAGIGTYFNGLRESGATVYIGNHDNMEAIADLVEKEAGDLLSDGNVATAGGRAIRVGSGSDIEVRPKITARFDVAKTPFGPGGENKKYAEAGLPTWTGFGGFPVLLKYARQVAEIEGKWNELSPSQRGIYNGLFKRIFEESRNELRKDFGEAFLEGEK